MQTFKYQLSIRANSEAEAKTKIAALATLGSNFDPRTLKALADKAPAIMKDPVKGRLVRSQLGI